jgi:hypothetical protein
LISPDSAPATELEKAPWLGPVQPTDAISSATACTVAQRTAGFVLVVRILVTVRRPHHPTRHHTAAHAQEKARTNTQNPRRGAVDKGARSLRDHHRSADGVSEVPNDPKWDRKALDAAVASGKTQTIHLAEPMPVLLLYWTARGAPDGGRVEFFPDVYRRDRAILRGLNGKFRARQRHRRK